MPSLSCNGTVTMDFDRPIAPTDYSQGMWELRYAPHTLQEVVGNGTAVALLQTYLQQKNIPNLIIAGPSGVGKKSAISCLTREYLGPHYREGLLEIDGSINRGKDVVSEKRAAKKSKNYTHVNIAGFIRQKTSLPPEQPRLIVIYDFDYMTDEAQMALRRIVEIYAQRVRFIFVCNEHRSIIEAIQSRCQILCFTHLTDETVLARLTAIASAENKTTVSAEVLDLIVLVSAGDLKQAVNMLQMYCQLPRSATANPTTFYDLFGVAYVAEIIAMCQACQQGAGFQKALSHLQPLLDRGFNSHDVLDILLRLLTTDRRLLDHPSHARYLEAVKHCYYMTEYTNSTVHLYEMLARLAQKESAH